MNIPEKKSPKNLFNSFLKSIKSFVNILPVLIGVVLLLGLFRVNVSPRIISSVFRGNLWIDSIIGSIMGSLSAGNPITSYIIGDQLLKGGVDLFAVTAFIIAWVTVGIIQLPAEAAVLGKRFAFIRNLLSFILAILASMATVSVLNLIQ